MDKYNLSEVALSEIGRIIKLYLDGHIDQHAQRIEDAVFFNYHSDLIGDMVHFRYFTKHNIVNGDVNNGGHFNANILDKYISLLFQQSSNSAIVYL